MRKALIICGSARMNGVTDTMCRAASVALAERGYDPVVVYPADDIAHCRDCGLCADGHCVIDDGMNRIYEEFASSELLILASPVHFSGPSSIIKTAIDRFQPYWFDKGMPHPKAVAGLICAGSEKPDFRPTLTVFRAFSAMLGMEWLGHLEIPGTDRTCGEGAADAVEEFVGRIAASEER